MSKLAHSNEDTMEAIERQAAPDESGMQESAETQIREAAGNIDIGGYELARTLNTTYEDIMCAQGEWLRELINRAREAFAPEEMRRRRLSYAAPDLKQGMAYYMMYCHQLGAELPKEDLVWAAALMEGEKRTGAVIAEAAIGKLGER